MKKRKKYGNTDYSAVKEKINWAELEDEEEQKNQAFAGIFQIVFGLSLPALC